MQGPKIGPPVRQGTSSQYQYCYLDLVSSTNSIQIVRRQCCQYIYGIQSDKCTANRRNHLNTHFRENEMQSLWLLHLTLPDAGERGGGGGRRLDRQGSYFFLTLSQLQTMTVLNQALFELLEQEFTNLYCKDYRKRVLWLILIVVVVSCCLILDDSPLLWPTPMVFLLLWNSTL